MLLKVKEFKSKNRARRLQLIGAAAQLALVAAILLSRTNLTGFDFLKGVLYGFAIVGNIAFLISIRMQKESKDV